MKNRKMQGFTLIELLIVIAIIGILAAVLIPQLLNARVSANKRAIQAHSSNVYKALQAALSDDAAASTATIGGATGLYGTDCMAARSVIGSFKFGYQKAPGATSTCQIAAVGNDFVVTVTGNSSAESYISTNGN